VCVLQALLLPPALGFFPSPPPFLTPYPFFPVLRRLRVPITLISLSLSSPAYPSGSSRGRAVGSRDFHVSSFCGLSCMLFLQGYLLRHLEPNLLLLFLPLNNHTVTQLCDCFLLSFFFRTRLRSRPEYLTRPALLYLSPSGIPLMISAPERRFLFSLLTDVPSSAFFSHSSR